MSFESYFNLARTMQMLSLDSPKVISQRFAMLAQSNAGSTARDRAEITRMFAEKQSAAMESCMSLWADMSRQYQKFFFESWAGILTGNYNRIAAATRLSPNASMSSTNRALKPYQRRASANVRRLSK